MNVLNAGYCAPESTPLDNSGSNPKNLEPVQRFSPIKKNLAEPIPNFFAADGATL